MSKTKKTIRPNKTRNKRNGVPFLLYLPEGLKAEFRQFAASRARTMSAEIILAMTSAMSK